MAVMSLAVQVISYGAGDHDFGITKIDVAGTTLSGSNLTVEIADRYLPFAGSTTDGGYALAGLTNSFGKWSTRRLAGQD